MPQERLHTLRSLNQTTVHLQGGSQSARSLKRRYQTGSSAKSGSCGNTGQSEAQWVTPVRALGLRVPALNGAPQQPSHSIANSSRTSAPAGCRMVLPTLDTSWLQTAQGWQWQQQPFGFFIPGYLAADPSSSCSTNFALSAALLK